MKKELRREKGQFGWLRDKGTKRNKQRQKQREINRDTEQERDKDINRKEK